jgi:hypothetical protein
MRVYIDNVCLCGETDSQFPDAVRIDGRQLLQPQQALRAEFQDVVSRGNRVSSWTFQTTREHDSHQAAVLWAVAHDLNMPVDGVIKVEIPSDLGDEAVRYLLGKLQSWPLVNLIGCTTVHEYTIVYGGVSTTKPEA